MKLFLIIFLIILSISKIYSQIQIDIDTVCVGSEKLYYLQKSQLNSIYTWGLKNSKGTISSGQNTDSITILWQQYKATDTLWVAETTTGGCTSDTAKLLVLIMENPNATIQNQTVCYGEELRLTLTGEVPFKIEYQYNNNLQTLENINQKDFLLATQPGKYRLLKVYDKNCVSSIFENTYEAEITQPLNNLKIIKK